MKLKFKEDANCGDLFNDAMKVKTKKAAQKYFEALMEYAMAWEAKKPKADQKTAEGVARIQKSNLGYWAGYYDPRTMARVYKLFETAHPIFGVAVAIVPGHQSACFASERQEKRGMK